MADKKKIKLTLAKGIARTRQDHRDTVRCPARGQHHRQGRSVGHRAADWSHQRCGCSAH